MKTTAVKPGNSALPVAARPVSVEAISTLPEAYSRSPTLMAGERAGSQGEVRVWAPERALLMRRVFRSVVFSSIWMCIFAYTIYHPSWWFFEIGILIFGRLFWDLASLGRPCYVTTDNAGIAITTWRGTRALRWDEIVSVEYVNSPIRFFLPRSLRLRAPKRLVIRLPGFSHKHEIQLLRAITARARLKRHKWNSSLYKRAAPELPEGEVVPTTPDDA